MDDFQSNVLCKLFFVSKRAGGTGLNITAADRVLVFEPNWNPTLDLQAQDRAHRLGQKNEVKVYRLIVHDSIEQYQLKTQVAKNQISNIVLDGTSEEALFNKGEIGSMKSMLRIGDRFAENAGAGGEREGGFEIRNDLGSELDGDETRSDGEDIFGGGGANDCLLAEVFDKDMDVDVDPDLLDVSRDEVEPSGTDDHRRAHGALAVQGAEGNGAAGRCGADDARCAPLNESQAVDRLLVEQNANARVIFTTNVPKHMGHKQLLTFPRKDACGVNGGAGDVDNVDLDEDPMFADGDAARGTDANRHSPAPETAGSRKPDINPRKRQHDDGGDGGGGGDRLAEQAKKERLGGETCVPASRNLAPKGGRGAAREEALRPTGRTVDVTLGSDGDSDDVNLVPSKLPAVAEPVVAERPRAVKPALVKPKVKTPAARPKKSAAARPSAFASRKRFG